MLIIILFLFTILAPIIFWFWFFLSQDRAEAEPKKLLIKIFLLGIGASFFAYVIEKNIVALFALAFLQQYLDILHGEALQTVGTFSVTVAVLFFLAGVIEELLKYFILQTYTYSKNEFNQIADGIFYGITLALGFSFVENLLYLYRLSSLPTVIFASLALTRGIATMLLHITATGFIGYGLGKMKFTVGHSKIIILKFLFFAILLHGTFNVLLLFSNGIQFAFPILFFSFIYLLTILKKPETKLVWKLVTPSSQDTLNKNE